MSLEQLISIEESAKLAGVSLETIFQYQEFGLLRVEEQNGEKLVDATELSTLFHIAPEKLAEVCSKSANKPKQFSPENVSIENAGLVSEENKSDSENGNSSFITSSNFTDSIGLTQNISPRDRLLKVKQGLFARQSSISNVSTLRDIRVSENQQSMNRIDDTAEENDFDTAPHSIPVEKNESMIFAPGEDSFRSPDANLPVVSTAHLTQENISLKNQIEILKEERDWLRKRLELVELRSEREQMLLLANSETIRTLVNPREKRRWTLSLPWFK